MTSTTQTWTCWRDPRHQGTAPEPGLGWPRCSECGAAPTYPDRTAYLPVALTLPVVVPAPGTPTTVSPASAIVVDPENGNDEFASVYFEGWIHGPAQYGDRDALGLWEAGVEHAAGRLVVRYPTSAMTLLRRDALIQVATYDVTSRRVDVTDEAALVAWLGA